MSAILEPTPTMGPYRVTARSESVYLHTVDDRLLADADVWTVPAGDVSAVLAALDQAGDNPAYTQERAAITPDPDAEFAVSHDGDRLTVRGPGHLYTTTAELEYRHLPALRAALRPLAQTDPTR